MKRSLLTLAILVVACGGGEGQDQAQFTGADATFYYEDCMRVHVSLEEESNEELFGRPDPELAAAFANITCEDRVWYAVSEGCPLATMLGVLRRETFEHLPEARALELSERQDPCGVFE